MLRNNISKGENIVVKLQKILQKYSNLIYSDLLTLAKKNFNNLYHYFCSISENGDGIMVGLIFMGGCLASGRREFSYLERELMYDLFSNSNITLSFFREVAENRYSQEFLSHAVTICDYCPGKLKKSLRTLALCILAVDKHTFKEDTALIHKILQ